MQLVKHEQKNWLEWTVFAIGVVIIAVVLGILVWEIWTSNSKSTPMLRLTVGQSQRMGDKYIVPVIVANDGHRVAESVRVEVALVGKDGRNEIAEFQLQHVPQQSERTGVAVFHTDPQSATRVTARPLGFTIP